MRKQSWAAYGLIGLFLGLYALSMFLPGIVLNHTVADGGIYTGLNAGQATVILERRLPCWLADKPVHLNPDHTLADENGAKVREGATFSCLDPGQYVLQGYDVLDQGWLGPLDGIYAWYANVLALVALSVALIGRRPRMAAWWAFAAVILGLDAFRFDGLPGHNVPGDTLDHLADGFYVWEVSLLMLFASQLVTLLERRRAAAVSAG